MTTEKNFSMVINGLDASAQTVYVFAIQVGGLNEIAITEGQLDAALAAMQSALEATGATVAASRSVVPLDPFGADQTSRLLIDCTQVIADAVSIDEVQNGD